MSGTIVAIIGNNGCGKTTLLNAIAGLLPNYQGSIIYDKKLTSYVPDKKPAHPFLTPFSFLNIIGKLCDKSEVDLKKTIDHLIHHLNLAPWLHTPLNQLSKGTLQRVYLAQALLNNPQLLLLDEPFSGLDAPSTQLLQTTLHDFTQKKGAVLFTAHSVHHFQPDSSIYL